MIKICLLDKEIFDNWSGIGVFLVEKQAFEALDRSQYDQELR